MLFVIIEAGLLVLIRDFLLIMGASGLIRVNAGGHLLSHCVGAIIWARFQ